MENIVLAYFRRRLDNYIFESIYVAEDVSESEKSQLETINLFYHNAKCPQDISQVVEKNTNSWVDETNKHN